METVVTLYVLNGIAVTYIRYKQIQLLKKWIRGELPYPILIACKKHKVLNVRKLNPSVKIGKHPGFLKKDN